MAAGAKKQNHVLSSGGVPALRPSPFASGYLALESVAFRRLAEGDLLGALAAFRHAAELAELRRDHAWRGRLLRHIAVLYENEGAPQLAGPLYEEALRSFAASGGR